MTPTASDTDTATRLLDAAERAFAEKGFDGASVRAITAEAGANLAAAHYHFGSKEDLFVAVLARRMEPINRERLRLLDQAEARAAGKPIAVETVLEILVGPVLRAAHGHQRGADCFLRLFGRAQAESEALWKRIMDGPLKEIRPRVFGALQRALPHLAPGELALRIHFTIGVMKSVASDQHRLHASSGGLCDSDDIEGTIHKLVAFLAAGLRAPATEPARRSASSRRRRS
jgi:AcrR family transcriptional regulator